MPGQKATVLPMPVDPLLCDRKLLPLRRALSGRGWFCFFVGASIFFFGRFSLTAQESAAPGDGSANWKDRSSLTGDWGGYRPRWTERGLKLEFYVTLDVLANVSGGIRRQTDVLGNTDLLATLDLETLVGWKGGTVFLHGLDNYGSNPSEHVGDLQGLSSIEAFDTWKLFEAWYEQNFASLGCSLLVGLFNVNSEFDVIPSAGLFVHSAFGLNSTLGLSGINGPSAFPVTSLAARLQFKPANWLVLRAVVADGVPGDPANPAGTHIRFQSGDGIFAVGEIAFFNHPPRELQEQVRLSSGVQPAEDLRFGYFGKYAVGVWGYTSRFDDFWRTAPDGTPLTRRGSLGAYLEAEQRIYYEPDRPHEGLTLFARVGVADPRVNPADLSLDGGAVYTGLLPGRETDQFGLGVAAARLGGDYRESLRRAGTRVQRWETALELSYRAHLTPAIAFQPDVQYIIHPGGDASRNSALVIGTRLIFSF